MHDYKKGSLDYESLNNFCNSSEHWNLAQANIKQHWVNAKLRNLTNSTLLKSGFYYFQFTYIVWTHKFINCMHMFIKGLHINRHNNAIHACVAILSSHNTTRNGTFIIVGTNISTPQDNIIPPWLLQ